MPNLLFDGFDLTQIELRHRHTPDELAACFPAITELRPALKDVNEWVVRAIDMQTDGYRVLAASGKGTVLALAGYRTMETLAHGRFVYVDDLVTLNSHRNRGLGSTLLNRLSKIGSEECCRHLIINSTAAHARAEKFFQRKGLVEASVGFFKTLEEFK